MIEICIKLYSVTIIVFYELSYAKMISNTTNNVYYLNYCYFEQFTTFPIEQSGLKNYEPKKLDYV